MSGEQSMAEALSSKWDEMEADTGAPETEAPAAELAQEPEAQSVKETPEPEAPGAPPRARAEDGKFAPAPKPPKGGKPPQGAPAAAAAPVPAKAGPRPLADKPPPSWMPVAREEWAKLPQPVQDQIKKREAEVSRIVSESAAARQGQADLSRVLEPFVPHLRAAGVEPLKHVETMFRTDYQLRTAPPAQRAALMASLIGTYGVDLEALNDALIKGGAQAQPAAQPEYRDPRVDHLLAQLQKRQVQQATQTQTSRASEVTAFREKNEFFEDVRETMAHIFDVHEAATARAESEGKPPPVPLTLERAYQQALTFPEHAGILSVQQQRKTEEVKKAQAAAASKARHASGSIQSQGAPPQAQKRGSVRDELEQGWERLAGQR